MNWRPAARGRAGAAVLARSAWCCCWCCGLAIVGAWLIGGGSMLFAGGPGLPGGGRRGPALARPAHAERGRADPIPANYLHALPAGRAASTGCRGWCWPGIGKVETNDGRTTLPGVHSGANAFGAAGPMQIGIGGAAGNTWGGAPVHPASEQVAGVATDGNGDGIASVYEPADAIAGAAKYLLEHGVQNNVSGAIFAYNHLQSYVQTVLSLGGRLRQRRLLGQPGHRRRRSAPRSACQRRQPARAARCPNQAVAAAIAFAGRRSASRTCGAAPARTRSTAPG